MSVQELIEGAVAQYLRAEAAGEEAETRKLQERIQERNKQFTDAYAADFSPKEREYLDQLGAAPQDPNWQFNMPHLAFRYEGLEFLLTVDASGRWYAYERDNQRTLRDENTFTDLLGFIAQRVAYRRDSEERYRAAKETLLAEDRRREAEALRQQAEQEERRRKENEENEARLEEQRRVSNEIAPTIMAAEKAAREGAFTWPETGVYLLVWQVEYTERRDEDMRDIRVVRYQRYEPSEPDSLGSWFTFEVDTQHPSESQILLHWIASLPKVEKLLLTADPATWPDALAEETFFTVSDVGVLYEEEGKFFTPCKGLVTQVSLGRQPVQWIREIVERVDESNKGKR